MGGILAFRATLAEWASFLVFGFLLAVLGVVIGGLVYNAKKVVPAAKLGRIDVLLSLESEERKHVRRQIAGKAPIDPENLAVTGLPQCSYERALPRNYSCSRRFFRSSSFLKP
jgi:hypothetical protein